jgi:SSS family solute:Na+ symporter
MTSNLVALDYAVIAAYLGATLLVGLGLSRRIAGGTDYFLAGRRLPWWAVGMSLVATDIGGTDIIGVGGAAYQYGLAVANFEWIGCVPAMIVAAFVFVPYFWRTGIATIPEFMERRYNPAVRSALAFCWLTFMACNLGVMLLASAKFMEVLIGWNVPTCIVVSAVLVGVYTISGGLAAVVYTDVIQCIVMIAGCLAVVVIGVIDLGGIGSLLDQIRSVDPERTRLVLPADTAKPFPWTGIFFGLALILSPAYWFGNQAIIQRALGSRSEFEAKASYVWGALLKNLIPIIIAVPGLIALIKFPHLQDGDQAVPNLMAMLLPAGLRGIFVAAFLAALMSSVDSYLNSASTILTLDLYQRFIRPDASDRHLLVVGRAATVALTAWGIFFALVLTGVQEGIYAIFQTLMAFFQGPALAILLLGMFWRRATGTGALAGFVAGICCSVSLFALNRPAIYEAIGWPPLFNRADPYLFFSIWAFLTAAAVVAIVSLLTPPEPEKRLLSMYFSTPKETP